MDRKGARSAVGRSTDDPRKPKHETPRRRQPSRPLPFFCQNVYDQLPISLSFSLDSGLICRLLADPFVFEHLDCGARTQRCLCVLGQERQVHNPSKMLVDEALFRWNRINTRADNTSVVTVMLDPAGPSRSEVLLRQRFLRRLRPREEALDVEQTPYGSTCGECRAKFALPSSHGRDASYERHSVDAVRHVLRLFCHVCHTKPSAETFKRIHMGDFISNHFDKKGRDLILTKKICLIGNIS